MSEKYLKAKADKQKLVALGKSLGAFVNTSMSIKDIREHIQPLMQEQAVELQSKKQIWEQVKSLGNTKGFTWRSPMDSMKSYIDDEIGFLNRFNIDTIPKVYINKPDFKLVSQGKKFKGNITTSWYYDMNPDESDYTEKSIKGEIIKLFKNEKEGAQIALTFIKDGDKEYRYFTFSQFLELADNGFIYDQTILGSDSGFNGAVMVTSNMNVGITHVKQIKDIKGFCNQNKTCLKNLKNMIVNDVRTQGMNCFDQCIKSCGIKCKKLGKQGVTIQDAIDYIKQNKLPLAIVYDQIDENKELVYPYKAENYTHTLTFIMKEEIGHWAVFERQIAVIEKKDENLDVVEQKNKNVIDIYYDFETTFNKEHYATPYSLSYYIDDGKSECQFLTILETKNFTKYLLQDVVSKNHPENTCYNLISFNGSNFDDYIVLDEIADLGFRIQATFSGKSILGMRFRNYRCWDLAKFLTGSLDSLCTSFQTTIAKVKGFNHQEFQDASDQGLLREFIAQNKERLEEYNNADVMSMVELTKKFRGCIKDLVQSDPIDFSTIGQQSYFLFKDAICHKLKLPEHLSTIVPTKQHLNNLKEKVLKPKSLIVLTGEETPKQIKKIEKENIKIQEFNDAQTDRKHTRDTEQKRRETDVRDKIEFLFDAPDCEEKDLFIRKCLNAGRTEVMKSINKKPVHLTGQKLSMVDVVSLYPSVMINDNKYPCGKSKWVMQQNKDKIGFYQIKCQQRNDMPNVLPKRNYIDTTQPLNWKCKDYETFYCTTTDIEVLRQHGNKVQVIKGLEYESYIMGNDLFACLQPFKNEKIRQDCFKEDKSKNDDGTLKYNVAMRETCKLYLNSLSGKVIQRNFTEQTELVRTGTEYLSFLQKCAENSVTINKLQQNFVVLNGKSKTSYSSLKAKPSQLGVYIYAYARKLMYNSIFTEVTGQYTDTDSCLITYNDEIKLRKNRPELFKKEPINIDGKTYMIKPFGSLDCEINSDDNINEAILLQPKNYLVMNRQTNNLVKVKCKGVSFKSQGCKYADTLETLKSNPIRFFDTLLTEKSIKVQCEQFTIANLRNQHTTQFGIKIRICTKNIKISE